MTAPDLLIQLGRIVHREEELERHVKQCKSRAWLAEEQLKSVRLERKNLTNRLLGRGCYRRQVEVVS